MATPAGGPSSRANSFRLERDGTCEGTEASAPRDYAGTWNVTTDGTRNVRKAMK